MALFDLRSFAVVFLTDAVSDPSSPIISIYSSFLSEVAGKGGSVEGTESENPNEVWEEKIILLTKNANVVVLDTADGSVNNTWCVDPEKKSTAISMHFIGKYLISYLDIS